MIRYWTKLQQLSFKFRCQLSCPGPPPYLISISLQLPTDKPLPQSIYGLHKDTIG